MSSNEVALKDDKLLFFETPRTDADITTFARKKSYTFLATNHNTIENEASRLEKTLERVKIDTELRKQYEQYLAYCKALLEAYSAKRGESGPAPENLTTKLYGDLGMLHAYRIMTTFGFLTSKQVLTLLNEASLLDPVYNILGPGYDFQLTLDILSFPGPLLNALSVSILGLRFLIDSMRVLRHVINPTEAEKELNALERFGHEAYKYRVNLINDFVWITFNGLSNFPGLFHVSPLAGNLLLMGGLLFDVSFLIYRFHTTQQAYAEAEATLASTSDKTNYDILKAEKYELELQHIHASSNLKASLVAASTLASGFALFLLVPIPAMVPVAFFVCILGTALYLASGHYADYQKQTALIKQLEADGIKADAKEMLEAKAAQQKHMKEGWEGFAKDIFLPLLFIGTLAICWPAGICLMVAYAAYAIYNAHTPSQDEDVNNPLEAANL